MWIAVAGSENSAAEARSEFRRLIDDPRGALADKQRSRRELARWTRLDLPGDPLLEDSIDWGKQNLADLTQLATGLDIRWTNQGKEWTPRGLAGRACAGSAPASPTTRGCSPSTARTPRTRR